QLHDWYGRRQRRTSAPQDSTAGGSSIGVAGPGGARTGGSGATGAGGVAAGGTGAAGGAGPAEGAGATGGAGAAEGTGAAGGVGAAGGAGATGGIGAAGAGGTTQLRLFFTPPSPSSQPPPDSALRQFRGEHSTATRLLATVVTDPLFESAAASALVAELVDFAAHCRLDYAASLVAESESFSASASPGPQHRPLLWLQVTRSQLHLRTSP
ncbi:unnamed protein product, partial [Closterium sp. NIES-53]